MTDLLEIAIELIKRPSVTPDDAGIIEYLAHLFAKAGFIVEHHNFGEKPQVKNLFVKFGQARPHLLFLGHVDVVEAFEATLWRFPPFSAKVTDGHLWGRGAVDMKGGCAAFIDAALRFVSQHSFEGSLSMLFTSDEEGPAINGTVKALEYIAKNEQFDFCLTGEPTSKNTIGDTVKTGRRGSVKGEITVFSSGGHTAYPGKTINPVEIMAKLVTELSKPLDKGSELFEPSRVVFTSIDTGNHVRNVIASSIKAKFDLRFNNLWTAQSIYRQLEDLAKNVANNAKLQLEFLPTNSLPFQSRPSPFSKLLVEAITSQTGIVPKMESGGGTSDARFAANYCAVAEFGSTNKTMHEIDENIAVSELKKLGDIYFDFLSRFFTKK